MASQKLKKVRRAAARKNGNNRNYNRSIKQLQSILLKLEFYNDGSEEVYEALKDYASKEMLKSAEMWTAKFEYKDKEYGIMGDGEITSSGRYVLGEIEDEEKSY